MAEFNDFNNPQVALLPQHLKQFVVDQRYEHYTPVDQAVWRYVMRQNYSYLKDVAYYPYIPGLKKAGLTIEKIPSLQEMNDALGKIGWGAVTVDGFIPPAAFMEFQAYKVLVIAADIRQLKHIEYTPAPDIIHESAGHAPIIAEKEYHEYLSYIGSIGSKAMFSAQDFELYEAIRELSILKDMPNAPDTDLKSAEDRVAKCQENLGEPSEMALLSRLHWWTVEYGLIGTLENPKIYGAGLLSSIGESVSCMKPEVKKLPYTIDAINFSYDITRPQPQLFVTPDFGNLIEVLEAFASTMAFRVGGTEGMEKAIKCKNTCTAVYSSGLQISGTFSVSASAPNADISFVQTIGPTALAFENKQLLGHGKIDHAEGFSSPVGRLRGIDKDLEDFTPGDLDRLKIIQGNTVSLHFESGISVSGSVRSIYRSAEKILLISFDDCLVENKDKDVLFDPSWGIYDMAIGSKIVSVFCGAADKAAFEETAYKSERPTFHPHYDTQTLRLHELYRKVREIRQTNAGCLHLPTIFETIEKEFPEDWLCALEILEIVEHKDLYPEIAIKIAQFLEKKIIAEPETKKLIEDGFHLIKNPIENKLVN